LNGYLVLPDGHKVPIADGLIIGRDKTSSVRIRDPKASREHARVIVEASVVEIEDLGSSNGTRLNGKTIRRRVLRPGDVIQIGTTLIAYSQEPVEDAVRDASSRGMPSPGETEAIEFVDETVEVPKLAPLKGAADELVSTVRRPLHYSKKPTGRGFLGDDLRQMAGPQRLVVVVMVVVLAAAMGYAALRLAAS
jgi:hypothetical protein